MSQSHRPQQDNFGTQSYSPAPVPFNLTLPQNTNLPNGVSSEYTNGSAGPSNPPASSADGSNGNGNFDQAALQARIALAQQMAQQGMQQQSQHEQQMQNAQQGQVAERKTSGPTPDWSQLAQTGAGGIISGAQGATREALMKQLQALQSSHAAATRNRLGSATGTGQSPPAPSPAMTNGSIPSPVPNQAALQMDHQSHQSPASIPRRPSSTDTTQIGLGPPPSSTKSHASTLPPTPSAATAAGAPSNLPPQSATTPTTATTIPGSMGSPIRPPISATPRPPHNLVDQRRQFLTSLISFNKQRNLKIPPEIVNGERDGAIKMGDTWVEVVELFMAVLRVGGLDKVSKLNAESPFWQGFLRARKIPSPLPSPINLPQPPQQIEPVTETTTDPIQFLLRAYTLWLSGFEQHMQQSQLAMKQRNVKQGARPPASSTPGPQTAPSPASTGAPTPAAMAAPSPIPISTPAPRPPQTNQADMPAPGPPQQAPPPPQPVAGPSGMNHVPTAKSIPPPIKVEQSAVPIVDSASTPGATPAPPPKRKYTKRKSGAGSAETSRPVTPAPTTSEVIERPPTPKRKRYKVEYKPLHLPMTHLAGWDERAVSSTFPKNNIGHPARSIHELESVDMEAIIMGIRSRIPRELGYGLTVLSMLSMGVPEENIHGLPLAPVPELYHELLELLSDATFGEDGYTAWSASAPKKCHLNDMSFGELEQLGRDMDFGLEERRDNTGGQTDVVLSCLNLLRNFSILPENWQLMSRYPEVFETLARVTDGRLCRLPYDQGSSTHKPYSLYELARVRRDVVTILSNLGASIDLTQASSASVEQTIKVISSFLVSGFTMQSESLYGPNSSTPPIPLHSVNRAVEAFCKLSWSDSNREILSKLSADLHVTLFESMIKLLPVQTRQFEHLRTSEDYLGQVECLALSLYSLAFTAPLATRSTLRHVPGAVSVITRLVHNLTHHGTEYRVNPYGVLVRRLAEILGILNGTSGLSLQADPVGMSFSAVLGDDSKSRSGNKVIEKGWLAFDQERITDSMTTRGLEGPAFVELDNLWWGTD